MLTIYTATTGGSHHQPPDTVVGITNGVDRVELAVVPGHTGPAYWTAVLAETAELPAAARQLDPAAADPWLAALTAAIEG